MFNLTASISPNLFVLYVSQYIYLESIKGGNVCPKRWLKRQNSVNVCPQKVALSLLLEGYQGWLFKLKNWLIFKICQPLSLVSGFLRSAVLFFAPSYHGHRKK